MIVTLCTGGQGNLKTLSVDIIRCETLYLGYNINPMKKYEFKDNISRHLI